MATAGLLAWANPLAAWLGTIGGGRMPRWLAESLGISLAAQAATLPDVLATFGRLSLVAPVVNLAVVPLVPVAMLGGLVAMLAGGASMLGAPSALATIAGLPGLGRAPRRRRDRPDRGLGPVRRGVAAAGRRRGRRGRGRGRRARAARPSSRGSDGRRLAARVADGREPRDGVAGQDEPPVDRTRVAHRAGRRRARDRDRRRGVRRRDPARDADHRPRRRAGRRDPARDPDRRPDADRRRPRSGTGPARARRAHPALGPPARHPRAHASARGPRRGAGPDPRALRGRTRLRARHARAGARLGGMGRRAPRRTASRRPRHGRADPAGRGPPLRAVAGPGVGAAGAAGHRDRDQQRVGRVPRARPTAGGSC